MSLRQSVADAFGVPEIDMIAYNRSPLVVDARQAWMLLLREHGGKLEDIAGITGRNHGTVVRGIKRIKDKMETEPKLKAMVNSVRF